MKLIDETLKTWWVGDSRVEKYMKEVSKVLDSVDIDKADRTSIYNRSYEAVYRAIVDYDKGLVGDETNR